MATAQAWPSALLSTPKPELTPPSPSHHPTTARPTTSLSFPLTLIFITVAPLRQRMVKYSVTNVAVFNTKDEVNRFLRTTYTKEKHLILKSQWGGVQEVCDRCDIFPTVFVTSVLLRGILTYINVIGTDLLLQYYYRCLKKQVLN